MRAPPPTPGGDTMPTQLLQSLTSLAHGHSDQLSWFAQRMQCLQQIPSAPQTLPMCALLPAVLDKTTDQTRTVVETLIAASASLRWQQTYTQEDGFSRDWLENYGWVNLVSPQGLFHSDEIRVSIGYWGAGQHYDEHAHAPEEFYLVLAGGARFHSDGRASFDAKPGDTIHHLPHQKHAIDMTPGPLLAAAFWRGDDLLAKSKLGDKR